MDRQVPKLSAVYRTLGIPEVLDEVVNYAPRSSLPTLARVNRDWSEAALDHIWKVLPALLHLARILHPLEYPRRDNRWHLANSDAAPNWPRFLSYVQRIRSLTYDNIEQIRGKHPTLAPDVFQLLASGGRLPPGIRTIEWYSPLDRDALLALGTMLPVSVSVLRLRYFAQGRSAGIPAVFGILRTLGSDFKLRELHFEKMLSSAEPYSVFSLISFLKTQSDLQSLGICCDSLEPEIIIAAGQLPRLRRLNLWWSTAEKPGVTETRIELFTELCAGIEEIKLGGPSHDPSSPWDIGPLLKWNLVDLDIEGHPSIGRYSGDLERMGKAWPRLKRMKINSSPSHSSPFSAPNPFPPLPLSTLERIVSLFPNLEDLNIQLHIDENLPVPQSQSNRLRALHVRGWVVPNGEFPVAKVAAYLATVCPHHDGSLLRWDVPEGSYFLPSVMEAQRESWEAVSALMTELTSSIGPSVIS